MVSTSAGGGQFRSCHGLVSELHGGHFYGTRVGWELGVWPVSQYWFDRVRQDNNCIESEIMPAASHSIGRGDILGARLLKKRKKGVIRNNPFLCNSERRNQNVN